MKNYYKKWKSFALLCFLFITTIGSVRAQLVNTYSFSQSSGAYTAITGGTTILAGLTDDSSSPLANIGFTFTYNGVAHTQFAVNSNGYLTLGGIPSGTYNPISTPSANSIAFAGRDGRTNQAVQYVLTGAAPNRILTIQFVQDLTWSSSANNLQAQVKLYETSNVVQIVYGATARTTTYTMQVGLVGASNTVYSNRTTTSNWAATAAGAANTSTMSWSTTVFPASGQTYTWTPPPATPPTPTQAAGTPSCAIGTTIDLAGPSPSGVTWYWQTSATGTSTANAYTAPLTIFANGTYYARAYNAAANLWSIASSSIVVTNFPVATAPPAPVALINPSCAPAGTTISVAAAPAGATYYWQGTNAGGSSNANNASTPLAVTSTGTYYVAAFEAATGCWSPTTGTLVTVNTVIPAAPVVAQSVYNVCSGTSSIPLAAAVPIALSAATCNASASASGNDNAATTATVNNFSCASGTIVGATLNASIGGQCPAWYYYAIVVNGVTVATNQCNQNGFNLTPYLPLTSVSIVSSNNPSDSPDFVTMNLTVVLSYLAPTVPQPAYALTWYNAATGGTQLGSGSPLEAVGSSVMPTPTLGTYNFYVETGLAGCVSTRQLVNVNVVDVNVALTPVQESCTNYSNGSFTLGTVTCGTAPFTYSTDGGVTFGAIPNNLTAGTYSVIAKDVNNLVSGPISVVITTQSSVVPPAAIVTATDYNYCVGVTTAPISAAVPVQLVNGTCSATASASGTDGSGVTATVNNFTCALGTITAATMNASIGSFCTSWYSYSIKVNGITIATNQCNVNNFDLTPYLPITSVQVVSQDNDAFGDFVTMSLTVNITYSGPSSPQPAYSLAWFNASTGGNQVGSGTPFETIGTSVMPAAVFGAYDFFVATALGGCLSVDRGEVTVNIVNVNAVVTPINATCNGGDNGSFVLGAVACGTLPFTYSVNGGTPGAIPTNLTAGTYTIVITDAAGLTSGPITVVITQPAPPAALTFIDANYFVADISWTTTGNETSWNVEFGPVGFTPGTGTSQIATASPYTITGLDAETVYEVYVTAICGPNAELSDALLVTTNSGFFTFDNSCGPGFQDISGSGTGLNLADDASTVITLASPVTFQGNSSSSITVSNNGYISFPGVTLNAWNLDLDSEEGNVFWQETTIAGDDYLIVEWYNRPRFPGIIGQNVTFEILMNKTTNEVYYIYDDVTFGGSQASNDYAASGLISATGPQGTATVSSYNAAYLTANSCVHFYNALCPNPINLTSQIFQEEVILDWGTGLYGETEWTVIYGPAGFDPATGGTTVTSANSDIDIIGLTQLTEYDVYIYSECTLDDLTSPGLLLSFQTLPFCSDPTGITTATDVDSLFSAWNWVETGPLYPSTGFNIQYGMTNFDLYSGTVVNANNDLSDTIVDAGFLAGGVYQVYVQAVCSSDTSNYAGPFTFIMPLSNDSVCGAEMLAVDGTVYYFNNVGATAQAGEAALITGSNPAGYNSTDLAVMTWGSPAVEGSNWYSFVAPTSGSMRFSGLDQNQFSSQIAIYALTDCGDFTTFELMGASDQTDAGVTTKLAPNFTLCGLTAGQTYYVLHDAWSNGFGGAAIFGQYSIKMTPIDLEAGSFVSMLEVCTGNAVVLFDGITGYQDGGTWTAELASVGTGIADSLFSSSGLSYQVHNFEYRVTDGCAYDSITSQVRIFPPSAAGPDGTLTVCRNEPYDLLSGLSGTVDLGGTWLNPSSVALPGSTTTASNLPGQYNFVYITGNGVCPDDTANVLVDVLTTCDWGNVDEMYFGTMTLLPNPTNGLVYITNQGSTEVFNYEITDIDGRIVATKKSAINGTSVTEINLNGKVTGMYMIRVFNDNAEKVFRVILQ